MSNPSSSLHNHFGLSHAQNSGSAVAAIQAMKMDNPTTIQRHNSRQHRRGHSQDSRSPIRRSLHQRTGSAVSITNTGSMLQGQQILREAQQQRIARPGQLQNTHSGIPILPQCGIYQSMSSSVPTSPFDNLPMSAIMQQSHAMMPNSRYLSHQIKMPTTAGLTAGFEIDENTPYLQDFQSYNQHTGSMSFSDRRLSQPDLRVHTAMRPMTPSQQIQIAQFPLTPAATPFERQQTSFGQLVQQENRLSLLNDKIQAPYPMSMKKSRSLQGIVEQVEPESYSQDFETADIPAPNSQSHIEPVKQEVSAPTESISLPATQPSSLTTADNNEDANFDSQMRPVPILASSEILPGSQSPKRPALSPRRMSITDLNLDPGISASIEETNISLDDIAQYIEGPDARDNKWICKYEDCNKRFGRKENIKSHVQTHLGDRQFKCNHCDKCFVRGHDLKRHAKIHTGNKPYPCACGNAFNRHDALTRHRQRGMCIGAFEGIVKKVIKRGRPRKHRPDMDERLDKASKTRHTCTNSEYGQDQYTSSASSCSMSSWGSPPADTMDRLSIRGQSPYEDFNLFTMPPRISQVLPDNLVIPADMFSFTPPTSPGYSTGNKPSPSYRELTPIEPTNLPSPANMHPHSMMANVDQSLSLVADFATGNILTANSMALQHSQASLPSLSHTCSSPAADIVNFDFSTEELSMSTMQSIGMGFKPDERNDFDNFLDYNGMEMGLDGNGADSFFTL